MLHVDENLKKAGKMDKLKYREYLYSREWKRFRATVILEAPFCRACNSTVNLCLHHIDYIDYKVVVLCTNCHRHIHRKTRKGSHLSQIREKYHKLYRKNRAYENNLLPKLQKLK